MTVTATATSSEPTFNAFRVLSLMAVSPSADTSSESSGCRVSVMNTMVAAAKQGDQRTITADVLSVEATETNLIRWLLPVYPPNMVERLCVLWFACLKQRDHILRYHRFRRVVEERCVNVGPDVVGLKGGVSFI